MHVELDSLTVDNSVEFFTFFSNDGAVVIFSQIIIPTFYEGLEFKRKSTYSTLSKIDSKQLIFYDYSIPNNNTQKFKRYKFGNTSLFYGIN